MKLALSLRLILLTTTLLCHFVYVCSIDCPQTVYVELGHDGIINCRIKNNGDVYWYDGNSTKTSPIVRRENGQKKISQEGSPYDMDEEGSLIIKSLEEQYYGFYSVLNFYANDQHETAQIKVEMAVKPPTMCPAITGCNDCDHCQLTESEAGNILCNISGTRPQVDLIIVTDSGNWIYVIQNVSESTYDPVTATWSTTTTVKYSRPNECGPPLQFRCVTESGDPFELSDSAVQVMSGSCKTTTQISDYETPLAEDKTMMYVLIAIVIAVVVMVIAIVLVLCLMKSRKSGTSQIEGENETDMEMQEETEPLQVETIRDTDRESLVKTLKDGYVNFRSFTCNPYGDSLPASDVFQDIYFTLLKPDNEYNIISSSELMERLFRNERNFVFLDDSEYGRKAFMHYVCSSLCTLSLDQNIILYVNLKGLDMNMTIANAVDKHMNLNGTCSSNFIRYIMKNKKCLFVFDEVNEIQSGEGESTSNTEKPRPGEETINDMLGDSTLLKKYRNVRILCIPNNKINQTSCLTKKQVCIKIEEFSLEKLRTYVTNIFSRYGSFQKTDTLKSNEKTESNIDESSNDKLSIVGQTYGDQHVECVSKLISEEQGIIKQIQMSPSLVILLVNSLVSDITNKTISDLRFYIHRRSYLTRLIVDCLRFQYFPSKSVGDDSELMVRLGQASFKENSLEDIQFTETFDLVNDYTREQLEAKTSTEDFEMALAMGLLKIGANKDCSKGVMSNDLYLSTDSHVEFRHNYIQEYLAAKAIASNKTVENRFLKSPILRTNDRMKRVLQHMHIKETKKRRELLNQLLGDKRWNNLIDCLFESENDDDYMMFKSVLPRLTGKYGVNIINLNEHHHRMAVTRFCEVLANHGVSLEALSFRKTCAFEHFSKLKIPEVNRLAFFEIDFIQENNFVAFVKKAFQLNVKKSIDFVKCDCPTEISNKERQEIAELTKSSSKHVKVLKTDNIVVGAYELFEWPSNVKWHKLNLETGCWEKS